MDFCSMQDLFQMLQTSDETHRFDLQAVTDALRMRLFANESSLAEMAKYLQLLEEYCVSGSTGK